MHVSCIIGITQCDKALIIVPLYYTNQLLFTGVKYHNMVTYKNIFTAYECIFCECEQGWSGIALVRLRTCNFSYFFKTVVSHNKISFYQNVAFLYVLSIKIQASGCHLPRSESVQFLNCSRTDMKFDFGPPNLKLGQILI